MWPSGTSTAYKKGSTFLLAEVQGENCSPSLQGNWRPLLGFIGSVLEGI